MSDAQTISGWAMARVGEPLELLTYESGDLAPGKALVEVAGCGVCHTDLGYLYDGVPVRGGTPLVLGHEIAGVVRAAGAGGESWIGRSVIVPAVMPCGECEVCRQGRSSICRGQVFPGNDIHGGFATHVVVPARGLCPVPDGLVKDLPLLSVVADAVTTPYHAVVRSDLKAGDVALFVGAGGIGAFGVQIAKATGATVVALDVDDQRLATVAEHGAHHTVNVSGQDAKAVRGAVRSLAKSHGWPATQWKIYETSGTPAGQATAFSLLNFGATLMVVGFTPKTVEVRLSNLMALDARAVGVWGCPPELYPDALALVQEGAVVIEPFVETHPLSNVNQVLADLHNHRIRRRVVLVPEATAAS